MQISKFIYKTVLFATLTAAVATTRSAYAEQIDRYQVPVPLAVEKQSQKPVQLAQTCGWHIILGCSRSRSGAKRTKAGKMGAPVLRTNNYPNFRNGWYCAYQGPYDSRSEAKATLRWWKKRQRDAYIKNGC